MKLQKSFFNNPRTINTQVKPDPSVALRLGESSAKLSETIGNAFQGILTQNMETNNIMSKAKAEVFINDTMQSLNNQAQAKISDPEDSVNVENAYETFWKPELKKARDQLATMDLTPAAQISAYQDWDKKEDMQIMSSGKLAFDTKMETNGINLLEAGKTAFYQNEIDNFKGYMQAYENTFGVSAKNQAVDKIHIAHIDDTLKAIDSNFETNGNVQTSSKALSDYIDNIDLDAMSPEVQRHLKTKYTSTVLKMQEELTQTQKKYIDDLQDRYNFGSTDDDEVDPTTNDTDMDKDLILMGDEMQDFVGDAMYSQLESITKGDEGYFRKGKYQKGLDVIDRVITGEIKSKSKGQFFRNIIGSKAYLTPAEAMKTIYNEYGDPKSDNYNPDVYNDFRQILFSAYRQVLENRSMTRYSEKRTLGNTLHLGLNIDLDEDDYGEAFLTHWNALNAYSELQINSNPDFNPIKLFAKDTYAFSKWVKKNPDLAENEEEVNKWITNRYGQGIQNALKQINSRSFYEPSRYSKQAEDDAIIDQFIKENN